MLLKPVVTFPSLYLQHKADFHAVTYLCPDKIKGESLGVRRCMGTRENVRTGARKPWHGERAQQGNRDTIANFSNGTLLSRLPS